MAFNVPKSNAGNSVFPYRNEYVIGIKNVEVVQLPIGSRPEVSWNAETETLVFKIANNSEGLEVLAPHADNIGLLSSHIDEIAALGEFVVDDRIIFIDNEYLATQGQVDFTFMYTDNLLKIEVFYNGRLLSEDDWYAHDYDTITLNAPVDVDNDIIYIRAWHRIKIFDTIGSDEATVIADQEIVMDTGTVSDFEGEL